MRTKREEGRVLHVEVRVAAARVQEQPLEAHRARRSCGKRSHFVGGARQQVVRGTSYTPKKAHDASPMN